MASTATSKQIIEASRDDDLRERFVAIAAAEGIAYPEAFVSEKMKNLVSMDLDGEEGAATDSIASVYEYAVLTYNPGPRPGENPAAVTDSKVRRSN